MLESTSLSSPKPFRRVTRPGPLRLAVVGAGGMGRAWLRAIAESPIAELAGVVDLDVAAARSAAVEYGLPESAAAASLTELTRRDGATLPDAVVNVTVPAAHLPVGLEAFGLGLPVLGEKPLAAGLDEARRLIAAADEAGVLFQVSQNRRYKRGLWRLKAAAGELGPVGILTHEFFKAPRFGGFRETMAHPLLSDMAIHNFDAARFLLDADPVAVYCEEYNPSWSWFEGDAATTAIFEMTGGVRFVYTGSWVSAGLETPWDSRWRVSAARGSATWDPDAPKTTGAARATDAAGETTETTGSTDMTGSTGSTGSADTTDTTGANQAGDGVRVEPCPVPVPDAAPPAEDLAGSLADFDAALRTGEPPMTEARDNLLSLAMVHAAAESSRTGARVRISDVL